MEVKNGRNSCHTNRVKFDLYHQADNEEFKWKSDFQLDIKAISPVPYMTLQYANNLKKNKF